MQKIVTRFPNTKDFVDDEKKQMMERLPELVPTEVENRPSEISLVKYALDSSMRKERRRVHFSVEEEIRRSVTRGVHSIQKCCQGLLEVLTEIFCFHSSKQGELLSLLKDFYGSSFSAILQNNPNISRVHAFFLIKFYYLVTD